MRCECGEPIESGQKFCIVCGRKIADASSGTNENASSSQNATDGTVATPDGFSAVPDDSANTPADDTIVLGDVPVPSHGSRGETLAYGGYRCRGGTRVGSGWFRGFRSMGNEWWNKTGIR